MDIDERWKLCHRDDLNIIPLMVEHGWTPKFDHRDEMYGRITPDNVPHNCVAFTKDSKVVWKNYEYSTGNPYWIGAILVNGKYTNHVHKSTIQEFLHT